MFINIALAGDVIGHQKDFRRTSSHVNQLLLVLVVLVVFYGLVVNQCDDVVRCRLLSSTILSSLGLLIPEVIGISRPKRPYSDVFFMKIYHCKHATQKPAALILRI
jgi:hypothetical protein